ncbi:MAG: thioredoxin family protein [Bacteroidota bacterium]
MRNTFRYSLFAVTLAGIVCFGCFSDAHDAGDTGIKWMTWKEALEANKKEPRKIFVDMYTDWCGWCKRMDATTFKDSGVTSYLNRHFYAVKMDAETMDTLEYKGSRYGFVPAYRCNELAAMLLNGQMSYPSSVYLDEQLNIISAVPGYMPAPDLIPVLRFFNEDIYKTKTWEEYNQLRK